MELDQDACYRAIQTRDPRFDGRLFIAVRTTGIYCRPICPARTPKRENVTFYPTAAAAQEAGYRPCLRCRPECSPDSGLWRGTSNTVSRALSLIEAGALDCDDIDALAGRLGVGERQLRRLFRVHLGASPIAVAQTRRLHLAKQLLHQTRLPMVEVALAAGFGSLRRFNETFRDLFGRPPTALRREASGGAVERMASGITLTLAYRPPYDWEALAKFLMTRAIPGVEHVTLRSYARTIAIDGVTGTIEIAPSARGAWLDAAIRVPRVGSLHKIIARIRHLFDLGADPSAISRQLGADALLAPSVTARPGLRVPGAWDPFELAVRAILGQQVSVLAAGELAGRLVAAFGTPLASASGAELSRIFPAPSQLAVADVATIGMPRARAAAVSALAAAATEDASLFQGGRPLSDVIARLIAIPGIGEWTAQYIALRAFGETDAFPAGDIGLQRALADADGRRPTAAEVVRRAEAWRPWRAYAALHLWTSDAHAAGPQKKVKSHAVHGRTLRLADRDGRARL